MRTFAAGAAATTPTRSRTGNTTTKYRHVQQHKNDTKGQESPNNKGKTKYRDQAQQIQDQDDEEIVEEHPPGEKAYQGDSSINGNERDDHDEEGGGGRHRRRSATSSLLGTPGGGLHQRLRMARILLYVSHFFSQFAECAWQFALILFLAAITNYQSVLLVSTYSLTSYATVCIFGAPVGRYIDTTNRLTAARVCILTENGSVLVATICCCWLLTRASHHHDGTNNDLSDAITDNDHNSDSVPTDALSLVLLLGIHVFGSLARVLDNGFVVAIERDWIVALSQLVTTAPPTRTPPQPGVEEDESSPDTNPGSAAEAWLSSTNVALRQIYLACKVLSPTFAGWIVGVGQAASSSSSSGDTSTSFTISSDQQYFCDLHGAAVLVGVLNITSLFMEYACTSKVYDLMPELAERQRPTRTAVLVGATTKSDSSTVSSTTFEDDDPEDHQDLEREAGAGAGAGAGSLAPMANAVASSSLEEQEPWSDEMEDVDDYDLSSTPGRETIGCGMCGNCGIGRGLGVFMQQSVAWGGISLALLGLNALCFGGFMTTYLLWRGMPIEEVGLWRGVGSMMGLFGTFTYQLSTKWTTVVNTGQWSIVYLFGCATLACASFLVENYHVSVLMLVVGSAFSRIGLWVFDISVTLLFQESVPDGVRGIVGGTQQAMSSFFTMLSGCLGLIFRKPEEFFVFAGAGYIAMGFAMVMYTFGVFRRGQQYFSLAVKDSDA